MADTEDHFEDEHEAESPRRELAIRILEAAAMRYPSAGIQTTASTRDEERNYRIVRVSASPAAIVDALIDGDAFVMDEITALSEEQITRGAQALLRMHTMNKIKWEDLIPEERDQFYNMFRSAHAEALHEPDVTHGWVDLEADPTNPSTTLS